MAETSSDSRQNPLLVFVVVGAVLLALLLAGLYFAAQRGADDRNVATNGETNNSGTVDDQAKEEAKPDQARNGADEQPATREQQETEETSGSGATTGPSGRGGGSPSSLPSAGPDFTITLLMSMLLFLGYGAYEYRRSRHTFRQAALRRDSSF